MSDRGKLEDILLKILMLFDVHSEEQSLTGNENILWKEVRISHEEGGNSKSCFQTSCDICIYIQRLKWEQVSTWMVMKLV
jgi:hypothetical protein